MERQHRGHCTRAGVATGQSTIRLSITSTTGSPVELTVPRGETVEGLKTRISQKVRLQINKMVLLQRNKQLTAGRLLDLGVVDGSKLTLVPVIEAGLSCSDARAEKTLMSVLESLTEVQISDFLSGRSPLAVNLRIGDHRMYVQLQLSAQNVAELQQKGDLRDRNSRNTAMMSPPFCVQTNNTRSTTSPASQTPSPAPSSSESTSFGQFSAQGPRTSFNSTGPPSNSSTKTPIVTCSSPLQSCHPHSMQTHSPHVSKLDCCCPHPNCSVQAATPVCSPAPTGCIPGPCSPAQASTFKESEVHVAPAAELGQQPGAVIESFGSHSPGVLSGTFSGTLARSSQSHPPSGVAIILQILTDLLRAASHQQGASHALSPVFCLSSTPPVSLPAEEQKKTKSRTLMTKRTKHLSKTLGEESRSPHSSIQDNQALTCKLERLQCLMHQRRLRRWTRRNSQCSQIPYSNKQRPHHP